MEKEIEVLLNPFIKAYLNDAMEQLEGQVASTKIALIRLASPPLYYVLSGTEWNPIALHGKRMHKSMPIVIDN